MAAYADYTFYITAYGGAAISQAAFDGLATRASAEIDAATLGKAKTATGDNLTAVKMATCAVAEAIQAAPLAGIKHESVGGHTVIYADGSGRAGVDAAVRLWLLGTGLMYRGMC